MNGKEASEKTGKILLDSMMLVGENRSESFWFDYDDNGDLTPSCSQRLEQTKKRLGIEGSGFPTISADEMLSWLSQQPPSVTESRPSR